MSPSLKTRSAFESLRTSRRASIASVLPPAMKNSSSVPTIRSKYGRTFLYSEVTCSDASAQRLDPASCPCNPHKLGRKSMSRMHLRPRRFAVSSTFMVADRTPSRERCVPVTSTAPARAR